MNPPTVELQIEKLVYGGDGLGRIAGPDGRKQAVFVPLTLPGERVRVELEPPRQGRVSARLLEVLEPSPQRMAPGCEYFGRCGGCQLQQTSAAYQLELKQAILIETLQRTGRVSWSGLVATHAAEPWGYRNRVRLQAARDGSVGYFEAGSRRVLPVGHCPIASPAINQGIAALTADPPRGRHEVELAVDNRDQGLESDAPLQFDVTGFQYRVSPDTFFQVNRFLAGKLVEVVTAGHAGRLALDLFSGVGLFALPLAGGFGHVIAVENHPAAVADLRHNAGDRPIEVVASAAGDYSRRYQGQAPDLLVADPPRAGLGPELAAALVTLAAPRIHLVSCDPATLGRDLRVLLDGGYHIEAMHLFDLFPQTYHIECVVKLIRG